jgi:uncharacterized membrane protein
MKKLLLKILLSILSILAIIVWASIEVYLSHDVFHLTGILKILFTLIWIGPFAAFLGWKVSKFENEKG